MTRLAVHSSTTGTRINGMARDPRVARIMLRAVSSVIGECSISIHRKSKPMSAACAAISTLGVERVMPTTGFFSRKEARTGFSQGTATACSSFMRSLPEEPDFANLAPTAVASKPLLARPAQGQLAPFGCLLRDIEFERLLRRRPLQKRMNFVLLIRNQPDLHLPRFRRIHHAN